MFHDDLDDEVSTFFETRRQTASRHRRHATTDSSTSSVHRTRRGVEVGDINTKLVVISERLKAESTRANAAEHRALDYSQRLHTTTEELKLYKLRLKEAKTQTFKAQDTISQVVTQRNEAEVESARARTLARKLREEKLVTLAREEGRKLGYREGRGMSFGQDDDYFYFDRAGGGGHPSRSSALNEHIRWQSRRRPDGTKSTAEHEYLVNRNPPRLATPPRRPTIPAYIETPRRSPVIVAPAPHTPVVPPTRSPPYIPALPPRRPPAIVPPAPHTPVVAPRRSSPYIPAPLPLGFSHWPPHFLPSSPSRVPEINVMSTPELTRDQPGSPSGPANFMPFVSSHTPVPENHLMASSNAATYLDGNTRLPQDQYEHGLPPSIPVDMAALHPSGTGSSPPPVRAHTPRRRSSSEDSEKDKNSKGDRRNRGRDWNRHEIESRTESEIGGEARNQIADGGANRTGTGLSADSQDELLPRSESMLRTRAVSSQSGGVVVS